MSNNTTPNIGLVLTPESSGETFKAWRTKINGEQNSNMTKIDTAIGEKLDANFTSNGYLGIDEVTEAVEEKHRAATIVIGTTNSSSPTKDPHNDNLDYICNGTNDHVKINEAITSLPASGGKIVLREGSYNISGVINCTKNIVFEGMGESTVLNFSGNSNVSQGDIQISFVGLKINFVSGPFGDSEGRSFVYGNKASTSTNRKVNITDCTLIFTNNSVIRCASAFKHCGHVKIINSSVELKNNATPTSSTGYTPRIYLIYDGHDDVDSQGVMNYAEVSNCSIECTGKVSGSYNALACVSHCGRAVISNSNIKLGICGSINDGVDVTVDTDISSITNCNISHSGTTNVYVAGYIFNGNVYTTTGGILYFSNGIIVMGNRFKNHATNDIKIGLSGSGTATIIGNRTSHTCEFTNSAATSTKKDYNT